MTDTDIAKKLDVMRRRMVDTLRDEIKSLYENANPDDEAFDELLANISDLIEQYQGLLGLTEILINKKP